MKQWLLAMTALLWFAVGPASAYFIQITIDLTKQDQLKGGGNQGGQMGGFRGMAGMAGQAGQMGQGGTSPGPPMGMKGMGGMGGAAGPASPGGMGGMAGMRGGFPMGGGGMGGVNGFGGSGAGAGGFRGMGGFAGFAGFNGNMGNTKDEPKILAKVIVELSKEDLGKGSAGRNIYYALKHKWGRAILVESDAIKIKLYDVKSVKEQYKKRKKHALADKTDKLLWQELAAWVLKHGLIKEFPGIMAEIKKIDPQDQGAVAFDKYRSMWAAWKKQRNKDEPTAIWMERKMVQERYETYTSDDDHYTLLTTSRDQKEIKRQLTLLEDTYKGFFYWFALKGQVLQVPRYRLVAVLVDDPAQFKNQRRNFRSIPMVADGFTIPRDNVAVISSTRTDDVYVQLDKLNQEIWREKNNRNALLKGTKKGLPSLPTANHEVLALVQKVMEEESAQATITHEGIYQLLAATGMPARKGSKVWEPVLARNLSCPSWIKFGMASFFETPRGAYWPGATAPSWNYLIQYKLADDEKKFDNMEQVLENVITDGYFREAHGRSGEQLELARTTAWALTYYLAETQPDKLLTYLNNLSRLPRNMEFDKTVLKNVFAQSVGDLKGFARKWKYAMRKTKLEVPGLDKDAKKARQDELAAKKAREDARNNNNNNGGNPFGPGGGRPPFGPGGGSGRPPN